MRIRTLALYLIGNRQAILTLAADRRALWVGLLFVLSAGFAREYDGEDLRRDPWYVLVPVGASLVASILLFLVACGAVFLRREGRPPFFTAYRSFLTLFWLTAPLAWLYAIPYERFLAPGRATSANLWTLAFVAAWRVALMIRVVSVITGRGVWPSLFLVIAFADAVAIAAIEFMPTPAVSFMGGVRLTESEAAVSGATFLVGFLGILSAPVWGIGGLIAFFAGRPAWQVPPAPAAPAPSGRSGWILAAAALLIWLPILPFPQAEQRLRSQVDRDMRTGRIAEALDVMSAHERSDFPPLWDPPPRIGYGEESPRILDVLDILVTRETAPWVRVEFVEKFRRQFGEQPLVSYNRKYDPDLALLTRVLQRLPEGPDLAAVYASWLMTLSADSTLSAECRANMETLLKLAEKSTRSKP